MISSVLFVPLKFSFTVNEHILIKDLIYKIKLSAPIPNIKTLRLIQCKSVLAEVRFWKTDQLHQ